MIEFSVQDVMTKLCVLSGELLDFFNIGERPINLYGVPRGGVFVAMQLLAARSSCFSIVDSPTAADCIIDDIIDSGKTKEFFRQKYPGKPFFVLQEKAGSEWVVFPWEKKLESDSSLGSGEDIATRLIQWVGEDITRGGLVKTPERFAKAWRHWTSGYNVDPSALLKTFTDGAEGYDEMVVLKSVPVWSQCEHHLAPFFGVAHVAYIPDKRIIGLSKISRIVDIFARRLQVQERLTNQVADALSEGLQPQGVGVILECRHTCMESRGIQQAGIVTSTCALRGVFRTDPSARAEFLQGCKNA